MPERGHNLGVWFLFFPIGTRGGHDVECGGAFLLSILHENRPGAQPIGFQSPDHGAFGDSSLAR